MVNLYLTCLIFWLIANATSISRRIASDREGLSFAVWIFWPLTQAEPMPALAPVQLAFLRLSVDSRIILVTKKASRRKRQLPTGSNPSQGGIPWPRLITYLTQFAP